MSYAFSQNCSSQIEASTLYWRWFREVLYEHSQESLYDVSREALPIHARCKIRHRGIASLDEKDTHLCDV